MSQNAKDDAGKGASPGAIAHREAEKAPGDGGEAGEPTALRKTALPILRVKWSESWIMRAAMLSSFILFLGFATSAAFTFKGIDSIAKLAHDDEIEASLGAHLTDLKRLHELQQELILERIKPLADDFSPKDPDAAVPEARLRAWLEAAKVEDVVGPAAVTIQKGTAAASVAGDGAKTRLKWIDRDHLKVLGAVLEFPRGSVYEAFRLAEDVKQRYQLVGAELNDNIRPTLIRASLIVLIASFLLLASIFVVYARAFAVKIREVIEGFALWSEKDSNFRFDEAYKGELKLITSQFNAMAEEVEANRQRSLYLEKIASWQIIARKLAHEIKNPLTPIQMMVSQLKRRYKGEDKEFGKLLDNAQSIITEEVSGLRRMVDNFSNFARLPQPELKATDLSSLCHHVVELEKNVFPQHTIAFKCRLASATASADEDLLRQVLINLVKNAGEACGEAPSKLTVGLDEGGGDWLITVQDDGPGIPPENLARIFEAYFPTKHTGPTPGMGLGLAVCQKIVIDHGGKMLVKSQPGETVFTIRLPRRRKDSSQH